jgi:hypothetical protein
MWDVDGSGVRKIEDASVRRAIRDRVNAFNAKSAVAVGVITAMYAALPVRS